MKAVIRSLFFSCVALISYTYCRYYKYLNRFIGKKRVLIYTDSRGFEVTKPWNRKSALSSYIKKIVNQYSCDVMICPEKHTSLLDFIDYYESNNIKYDYVILHCGIVDFAPRPESSFDEMYKSKLRLLTKYNLISKVSKSYRGFGSEYMGESTISFIDLPTLKSEVIPRLTRVDNLIYIGINRVLNYWSGQYWRKRPVNINEQLILNDAVLRSSENKVDLSKLTDEQIKTLTSDNVHYTKPGFDYIYDELSKIMKSR
jgi:hypothetical protein